MNKFFMYFTISIFMVTCSLAQFKKGDVELSFSGSFSSLTSQTTATTNSTYYSGSTTNSDTRTSAYLSVAPGYYFLDNFSIEGEFGISAIEKVQPAQYLLLNLAYTYLIPDSKAALFAHAGYGLSNSVALSYFNNYLVRTSDGFDVGIINLGAGMKFLMTSHVLLHTEVNYRIHNWSNEFSLFGITGKEDMKYSNISLLFGFSILI